MGTAERRNSIMKVLGLRRYDTIGNLASEFGVSVRTIRRDIEVLSLTEPIYTQTGRYGGGVYVLESYSPGKLYVSHDESRVLHKLYDTVRKSNAQLLNQEELAILKQILTNYTKPQKGDQYETERKRIA